VLLQVVLLAGDVGGYLFPVAEPHAGDLPKRRVGLLRSHGLDLQAHPTLLRGGFQVLYLIDPRQTVTRLLDQLVDRGHSSSISLGSVNRKRGSIRTRPAGGKGSHYDSVCPAMPKVPTSSPNSLTYSCSSSRAIASRAARRGRSRRGSMARAPNATHSRARRNGSHGPTQFSLSDPRMTQGSTGTPVRYEIRHTPRLIGAPCMHEALPRQTPPSGQMPTSRPCSIRAIAVRMALTGTPNRRTLKALSRCSIHAVD